MKEHASPHFSPRIEAALTLVARLHARQSRKGCETPYLGHLLAVTALVIEDGGSENEAIAALLHDAVEDQGGQDTLIAIREEFGEEVAAIVLACSDTDQEPKPEWKTRKDAYLHHLEHAPPAVLQVSLADKVHNAESMVSDYALCGEALWERFTGGREGSLWYYRSIAEIFSRRRPGPLADRLRQAVRSLEDQCGAAPFATWNFGRSFLTFRVDLKAQPAITLSHEPPTTLNNARIQLECRLEVTSPAGQSTTYVLGASCKTEAVGGNGPLWLRPNADFCLAASDEEFLIYKSWARRNMGVLRNPPTLGVQTERQSGLVKDAWVGFKLHLQPVRGRVLATVEEIIDATFRNAPLVAMMEWEENGYRMRLDHPVKTFNVTEREMVYQTDTGPVLLPDLSPQRLEGVTRQIECLDLAFEAFNSPTWAEFITNVSTPVGEGIEVNHYSQPRRIENMRNTLIEVE